MLRTYGTQDTSVKLRLLALLRAAAVFGHGVRAVASSGVTGDVQNAQRVASAKMSLLHSGHSRMSSSGSVSDAMGMINKTYVSAARTRNAIAYGSAYV